jgi:hypothetical protein
MYEVGDTIVAHDLMQASYSYKLQAPMGCDFPSEFEPYFTPKEMLDLGVFEGKYCNDCQSELPKDWFANAKINNISNPSLNYFGIKSRQPLSLWVEKGWIIGPDPRGWFQWYCRYFLGRRLSKIDKVQIKRWRSFRRHSAQVQQNCNPGDLLCRPRQRQALLQWSYNPFI